MTTGAAAAATTGSISPAKAASGGPGAEGIAAAALDAFHAHGFHGTTVRDIASRAGVTVAALYYHWPSKHDVLAFVMTRAMQDSLDGVRGACVDAKGDPTGQLTGMVRAHVLYHTDRQVEAFVGNTELRSLEESARRRVIALRDAEEKLFRDVVQAGLASGAFTTDVHPHETTRALLAMCTHVATWYRPGGPLAPEAIADRYVALALQLVGARKPRKAPAARTATSGARTPASAARTPAASKRKAP